MWFFEELVPGTAVFNLASMLAIEGPLDVAVLQNAIAGIVHRHEILRTRIVMVDGMPVQTVDADAGVSLRTVEAASPDESMRLAMQEARRPINLASGPLLRLTLVRLSSDSHRLVVVIHHAIADGWSLGIFIRELRSLYSSIAAAVAPKLRPLALQYKDFAIEQHAKSGSDELKRQLAYWKSRLGDEIEPLDLPIDHPRPRFQTFRGAREPFDLPPDLVAQLKELGRTRNATLFMVMLAGLKVLLSRYSGKTDVCVGSPIANRGKRALWGMIGLCVNTLALRTDLSGDPNFAELVDRVRETALGAYAHQDVPFEKLVEELRPERDLTRTPFFQVMMVLQNHPMPQLNFGNLRLTHQELDTGTSQFDFSIYFTEREDGGMEGAVEYSTELYEAESIRRMVGHYLTLLGAAVADPSCHISALPMLTAAERRQLLEEWNQTAIEYPRERSLHELFEAQASAHPERVAVMMGEAQVSYRELNERANRLAHHLRGQGAGVERLVGICLERSPELMVAMLGVLKAGAAYVPLDPSYPRQRLEFMVKDSGLATVVSEEKLAGLFGEGKAGMVVLERDRERIAACAESNPDVPVGPDNLAYVIYTSGSTGNPKGVCIEHRCAVNFVTWAGSVFREDFHGTLAATSVSFDLSIFEIFGTLSAGGTVIVAQNALHLANHPNRDAVTLINTVPSAVAELLKDPNFETHARVINLAGEPLGAQLAQQIYAKTRIERLYNLYGPSETTTYSTYTLVSRGGETPTIGRPIGNTRIYVLDEHGEPVPVGVAGEIYIGGEGVARGYLGRPELTAQKFVPDRFSADGKGRLYRTGDLARYRGDGNLEFMGRADHQLKIRGFRVEPGEVEAALSEHPGVEAAAVVGREEPGGGRRLVGYVVARAGAAMPAVGELREHLRRKLPEYMIPSQFVGLEALPLTASGKLDRKALPAPAAERPELETRYRAPQTELERGLAEIWSEALGVERVGMDDNFFDLGGHSLLATRVVARIRGRLKRELPLRALFEFPSIASLAPVLLAAPESEAAGVRESITLISRSGELPLSFAEERLWFLDRLLPERAAYNVPELVRIRGEFSIDALRRALRALTDRHEVLRTSFHETDGRPRRVIASSADLDVEVINVAAGNPAAREAEASTIARDLARRPFDLSRGPLLRLTVFPIGPREHLVLLVMHHIVTDGWSMGVMTRELAALYDASRSGHPADLPELPVQYLDFAAWQKRWAEEGGMAQQLDYWRKRLAGASSLDLPVDRPRPAVRSYRGATERFRVPPELARAIAPLCERTGTTLFMVLLAAFDALMARYSRQEDIAVGSVVANRNRQETEALLGFFVNTIVLRTDLSGDPSFAELVDRVRETALGAYAHQDVPFEKLVEELRPERDLARTPFFQVLFVLQNAPLSLAFGGLRLEPLAIDTGTSKFDLSWFFTEREDGGMEGAVEYSTELYEAESIRRMVGHYLTLLGAAVADPSCHISALPMLTAAERRQLLEEWNQTAIEYPRERSLHELFEAQASAHPERVAVMMGEAQVSYRELNERANRLAHHLRGQGAGVERLVGICLERSPELMVAMLGVLKAGAAYVPLDPSYPRQRLEFMVKDSGLATVVSEEKLAGLFGEGKAGMVVLERDRERIAACAESNPDVPVGPDNLAYVIYTSGSTGNPKGVAMRRRAIRNLIHWQIGRWAETAEVRTLQFASLSFDVATQEILSTLCSGGTLVLISEAERRDTDALIGVLDRYGVRRLFLPFVALNGLADAAAAMNWTPRSLREIVTAGEQLIITPNIARLVRSASGMCLENQYGPSETHVVTAWTANRSQDLENPLAPIGRPIGNTRIYVLDEHGEPVPVGVAGEIYIGGEGVARGYLGRPELTAQKFVPDRFSADGRGRLYRTGDLARYRGDGKLEFMGRADHQLKIRGFRVEPGEVEAALSEHPGVEAAAVVGREEPGGGRRLVGYVVARAGAAMPAVGELREHLRRKLPEYMIPSQFVGLEALPLTASGKLDRKALPAPAAERPELETRYRAPQTELERGLAEIWSEALGVERVGMDDNFFDLGGHSLLATRVVARIRGRLKRELPLRALFEFPSIASLAPVLLAAPEVAPEKALPQVAAQPEHRYDPFPLTDVQQAYWIGRSGAFELGNISTHMYVEFEGGEIDIDRFERTWNQIVSRHEMLRAIVLPDGRQQILKSHPEYRIDRDDLRGRSAVECEQALARVRDRMSHEMHAIDRWPLFEIRASLLDGGRTRIHFSCDVLMIDAWSFQIILREFAMLYATPDRELAPLELSFRDYVMAERALRETDIYQRSHEFWRERIVSLPAAPELPLAIEPAELKAVHFARRTATLEAARWRRLQERAQSAGITPSGALLAAYAETIAAWSKSDKFTVNLTLFNRLPIHPQVNDLVGDFTSLVLIAIDNSSDSSFAGRARRIQRDLWDNIDHRYVSGVEVMRQLARLRGGYQAAMMPVVFTSVLGVGTRDVGSGLDGARVVNAITQTPQVYLDHQVMERDGALVFNWDVIDELFPAGMMDDMFAAYCDLLVRLSDDEESWK